MAASPIYGSVGEYQSGNEPFSSYLERVELFFTASEVPEAKKVPVFLSVLGSKTYSVLGIISNVSHTMELDTGASVTLMTEAECHKLFPRSVCNMNTRCRIRSNYCCRR